MFKPYAIGLLHGINLVFPWINPRTLGQSHDSIKITKDISLIVAKDWESNKLRIYIQELDAAFTLDDNLTDITGTLSYIYSKCDFKDYAKHFEKGKLKSLRGVSGIWCDEGGFFNPLTIDPETFNKLIREHTSHPRSYYSCYVNCQKNAFYIDEHVTSKVVQGTIFQNWIYAKKVSLK